MEDGFYVFIFMYLYMVGMNERRNLFYVKPQLCVFHAEDLISIYYIYIYIFPNYTANSAHPCWPVIYFLACVNRGVMGGQSCSTSETAAEVETALKQITK